MSSREMWEPPEAWTLEPGDTGEAILPAVHSDRDASEAPKVNDKGAHADAWDEGYIHGRQMQAIATADEAHALSWTTTTTRSWLKNTARALAGNLRTAKGSIHDNPYRLKP